MHGYFLSLKLYDTARVIANPFAYAEHREKMVVEKMEKMAEGRIRAKKNVGVKVNRALAEKIHGAEEKEKRRQKKARNAQKDLQGVDAAMDIDETIEQHTIDEGPRNGKQTLLTDPRFKELFENPEFVVDETSREYALMNPSAVARKTNGVQSSRSKTAVEEEEEESDKASSDGLGASDSGNDGNSSDDSSDAGGKYFLCHQDEPINHFVAELNTFDPRARPGQKNERVQEAYARKREQNRISNVNFVPLRAQSASLGDRQQSDKRATFGQLRSSNVKGKGRAMVHEGLDGVSRSADGGVEMSWVPSPTSRLVDHDDMHAPDGASNNKRTQDKRKGVESFGAGMERSGSERRVDMSDGDRRGRTERRKGNRSGSKNAFRRM